MATRHRLRRGDYIVGWVCALPIELAAAQEMLDEKYDDDDCNFSNPNISDQSIYTLGRVGKHNVVIACLPEAGTGTNSAAAKAIQMKSAFPSIRFGLMVGVGGAVPSGKSDVRLGDVVVSRPGNSHGGVVQYDFGKSTPNGFERTGFLNAPPEILQNAIANLQANYYRGESRLLEYASKLDHLPAFKHGYAGPDVLFESDYNHVEGNTCEKCDKGRMVDRLPPENQQPFIHYGTIASGNQVMRDAAERDRVSSELGGVLCFEMEAAGLMNKLPCLVIRGICDYSDSHKTKKWQPYAAGVAAAYAKELLSVIPPIEVRQSPAVEEIVGKSAGARTFFVLPFQRDERFVGRESIMANIDSKFQSSALHRHLRVALVGMGGVGKSQIAIEYAYRARQRDPKLSVFWVYAGNTARFEQAYRDLADELDLPGRADPGTNVFKLVSRWLSDGTNGQWLMILDNADNEDMFFQEVEAGINPKGNGVGARVMLIDSIPQTSNGSVIITSRNQTAARNLFSMPENIIAVDVMEEKDALSLLQTKLTLDEHSMLDAQRLIQNLECIPLAIIQAGSYIQTRSPRITISKYLTLLQEGETSLVTLLGQLDVRDPRRDSSAQHVVTMTWQISFNQIQTSHPASASLLALMSMFDRHGIPEYLLQHNMTCLECEDAIHPLISFSLIKESKDQQSFAIHRLVQISVRKWLESNNQLELWIKRSTETLAAIFPSGDFETYAECQILIPHAKEILRHDPENNSDSTMNGNSKLGLRQHLKRKIRLRLNEELRPDNQHLIAWAAIAAHANCYLINTQGKYEEAEVMLQRAIQSCEKVLGADHPATLTSISNLGLALYKQGKFEDAEVLLRRVFQYQKKVLGADHHSTLNCTSALGLVLYEQNKYEEAEMMLQYAFQSSEKIFGTEHPHTLYFMKNFGRIIDTQGKYEEAEIILRRAFESSEKVLDAKHPIRLDIVRSLGSFLYSQGKYEEAEAIRRKLSVE